MLSCFSRVRFLRPGGIEPGSPALWVDSLPSEPPGKPLEKGTEVHHKAKNKTAYDPTISI